MSERADFDAYGKDADAYWNAAEMARECLGFTLEPGAEELRLMVGWFNRRASSASQDKVIKGISESLMNLAKPAHSREGTAEYALRVNLTIHMMLSEIVRLTEKESAASLLGKGGS